MKAAFFTHNERGGSSYVWRLDYLSCVLTIASTILLGRRCWEGWALCAINSVIICIIALRTAQTGFIPANIFCLVVSAMNLHAWRKPGTY
jgi:nicotinamide riboside transporter PnuC